MGKTVGKVWGPVLLIAILFACFGYQASAKELNEVDGQLARVKLLEQTRRKELSVWRPFLQSKRPTIRLAALRAVGQARTSSATSILRSAINDVDPIVQETALFSLIQLEELDTSVLEALIANTSDPTVQARRIRFIGLAIDPVSAKFIAQLLTHKADGVRLNLILALRQRQILFPSQPALITGEQIAQVFEKGSRPTKVSALRFLRNSKLTGGPWQKSLIEMCAAQKDIGVTNECALTQDRLGNAQADFKAPDVSQSEWSTQVAFAHARAHRQDIAGLVAQIDASLAGIQDGSLPLETASFYGVITPIEVSIGMEKDAALMRSGQSAYDAIVLDGLSVNNATAGLGLSLSHLHCAAAALVDRNLEKVKLTKTCGAFDYDKALRDMWNIRAIMNWSPARSDR